MSASFDPELASLRRDAALTYLLDRIDYERSLAVPYRDQRFKLQRMVDLLDHLGNPQRNYPIVHVAGTKGKGSTSAMIASVLTAAGLRAGLFTSPHLERIEQRIMIDGQACSCGEFADLVDSLRPIVESMDGAARDAGETGPTYFELTTAMAMHHFAQRAVDVGVLEVGLGGRLDSTNVCLPQVAVITSISYDHQKQLGDTLAEIAGEKAGIIKPGIPVVSGVTEPEPRDVIRRVCRQRGCRLVELDTDFEVAYRPPKQVSRRATHGTIAFRYPANRWVPRLDEVALGLLGRHQARNAAVALAVLAELENGGWPVTHEAIRAGLRRLSWPARVEVVSRRPTVVVDTAHNEASVAALLDVLGESFSARRRVLIFATTQEKEIRRMMALLDGHFDEVVFTRYLENPRGVPPEQLAAIAEETTRTPYRVARDPQEAWNLSRERAGAEDLLCIAGSFFIAAEMRRLIVSTQVPGNTLEV